MKRCQHCNRTESEPGDVRVILVPSARVVEALRDDLAAVRAMHLADALYLERLRNLVAEAAAAVLGGQHEAAALRDLVVRTNDLLAQRADALGLPSLRSA